MPALPFNDEEGEGAHVRRCLPVLSRGVVFCSERKAIIPMNSSWSHSQSRKPFSSQNLYVNVVLSSGTTVFQRIWGMTKELTVLTPSTMKVKVVAPSE